MKTVVLDLAIPADEYLLLYKGAVKDVVAKARDGRHIRFPATILQRFVTHAGVYGTFTIYFDADHRFQSIVKNA